MILLIDNYDSFSYNLFQMVGEIDPEICIIRNDEMEVSGIKELSPSHIILSPGPGRPENAGNIIDVVKNLGKDIPLLGVCLGHQAICAAYGAKISYASRLMHGKQSEVTIKDGCPLFKGLPKQFPVARYHSLSVDAKTLPDELEITAMADDGEVMAVMGKEYPIFGVQFHPESILTPYGKDIIKNFIEL